MLWRTNQSGERTLRPARALIRQDVLTGSPGVGCVSVDYNGEMNIETVRVPGLPRPSLGFGQACARKPLQKQLELNFRVRRDEPPHGIGFGIAKRDWPIAPA